MVTDTLPHRNNVVELASYKRRRSAQRSDVIECVGSCTDRAEDHIRHVYAGAAFVYSELAAMGWDVTINRIEAERLRLLAGESA